MIQIIFTVVGSPSRWALTYPGVPQVGQRICIDGSEFVVRDSVVNFSLNGGPTIVMAVLDVPGWEKV